MTKSSLRGPQISAILLFRRVAPAVAQELSRQLHRAGLVNSSDLIWALMTGLSSFAKAQDVCLATDFPKAWPEALQALRTVRSEDEWERFLTQSSTAPQATPRQIARGAAQMIAVLEALSESVKMRPQIATALGIWVLTAVVVAHSGPLDADLSLEDLADCF